MPGGCHREDPKKRRSPAVRVWAGDCKSIVRLKYEDPAQFVIASVLLEVRASEGSEIEVIDCRPGVEIRVRLNPQRS